MNKFITILPSSKLHSCFIYSVRLFFLCLIPLYAVNSAASGLPESFNLNEVAPGIYVHKGLHVDFEHPQHDDIANIGFIIGDKCIAVIDSGGSFDTGKKLLETIHKKSNLPVCYVINTHIHFDHVLGNNAFSGENPDFVGHYNLVAAIEGNREFFLQQFSKDLGPNPSENSIIGPNITVKDTLELDLGNRVLLLTAYQTAHTDTDLTVLDKNTRTLWTGDLIFKERIPALDGSLKGWLTVLEQLEINDINFIIPGHGSPTADWKQSIEDEKRYLTLLLNDTRRAIDEGMFMEEVIDTVGANEKKLWLLYDQHHRRNVSTVYRISGLESRILININQVTRYASRFTKNVNQSSTLRFISGNEVLSPAFI